MVWFKELDKIIKKEKKVNGEPSSSINPSAKNLLDENISAFYDEGNKRISSTSKDQKNMDRGTGINDTIVMVSNINGESPEIEKEKVDSLDESIKMLRELKTD